MMCGIASAATPDSSMLRENKFAATSSRPVRTRNAYVWLPPLTHDDNDIRGVFTISNFNLLHNINQDIPTFWHLHSSSILFNPLLVQFHKRCMESLLLPLLIPQCHAKTSWLPLVPIWSEPRMQSPLCLLTCLLTQDRLEPTTPEDSKCLGCRVWMAMNFRPWFWVGWNLGYQTSRDIQDG